MDIMTNATPVHGRVYNLTLLEDIAMQEWVKSKPAKYLGELLVFL
jgi:hypothetical protein